MIAYIHIVKIAIETTLVYAIRGPAVNGYTLAAICIYVRVYSVYVIYTVRARSIYSERGRVFDRTMPLHGPRQLFSTLYTLLTTMSRPF